MVWRQWHFVLTRQNAHGQGGGDLAESACLWRRPPGQVPPRGHRSRRRCPASPVQYRRWPRAPWACSIRIYARQRACLTMRVLGH